MVDKVCNPHMICLSLFKLIYRIKIDISHNMLITLILSLKLKKVMITWLLEFYIIFNMLGMKTQIFPEVCSEP